MTSEHSLNDHVSYDELPGPYRMALETILAEPVPEIDLARLVPDMRPEIARRPNRRAWMARVGGGLMAGAAAAALVAGLVTLRPAGAWAQVQEAMRKQAWIHLVTGTSDNGAKAEFWISPAKQIAATRLPGLKLFLDVGQNKMQRYVEEEKTIYTAEPGPADQEMFVLLETIIQSIAKGSDLKKGGADGVRLVRQSQRQRQEGDKRWTEHVLEFEHPPGRSPARFSQVFHVSAGEQLPNRMTQEVVAGDKTAPGVCDIDYPASGPADLFALDVPQDAKVVDLRTNHSLKSLLSEFHRERKRPLEPFSATMLESLPEMDWKDVAFARRIRKEGARLHVEHVLEDLKGFRDQIRSGAVQIPDGADRLQWWKAEVAKMAVQLSRDNDATNIYQVENEYSLNPLQAGYMLVSGVSAEGTSRTSRLTLNPRPAVGPSECVMVTAENASTGAKEWVYWFDPSRGHMIVRRENHQRAKPTDWIQTTVIDRAERSPSGRWYVTEYRRGVVEKSGDDLPARSGAAPQNTWVHRILVEFDK